MAASSGSAEPDVAAVDVELCVVDPVEVAPVVEPVAVPVEVPVVGLPVVIDGLVVESAARSDSALWGYSSFPPPPSPTGRIVSVAA